MVFSVRIRFTFVIACPELSNVQTSYLLNQRLWCRTIHVQQQPCE